MATLRNLWPRLAAGGLYFIEDVDEWREDMLDDRSSLVEILGRETPYFLFDRTRWQTATGSRPFPRGSSLGVLVIRKLRDADSAVEVPASEEETADAPLLDRVAGRVRALFGPRDP